MVDSLPQIKVDPISNFRNPIWIDQEKTIIDLTATMPAHGDVQHTVVKGDSLFDQAVLGKFGSISPFVPISWTKEQLLQHLNVAQNNILNLGIIVNVSASGTSKNVLVDGGPSTQASLALLSLWGQINPTLTKDWIDNHNVSTTLTGAEYIIMTTKVGNWISNTYSFYGATVILINSGSITKAQIDSLIWPVI